MSKKSDMCKKICYNNNFFLLVLFCLWHILFTSKGAAVMWINQLPCEPGFVGSIPDFSSLLEETLSHGPVLR